MPHFLLMQNVLMVFSAPPPIPTITRSSTTRSWPTVERTATSPSSVCPSRRKAAPRPSTPRWKAPFCTLHRTVFPHHCNLAPPLMTVTAKPHRRNVPMAFSFCGRLAQRILRKRKAGHPQVKAESLSALPRKVVHSFHPLLQRQRLKCKLLKVYPNVNLLRPVTN